MEISALKFFPRHTRITVRFHHHLYSSQIPNLADNLLQLMPSLRNHLCVNRNGLRFEEEVEDSELGHVFEHVILSILSQRGMCVRGQTTWNWHHDPLGTYQVTIHTGKKLAVKESLLIAQAVFTNAMLGPVVRIALPRPQAGSLPLVVQSATRPDRVLFAAEPAAQTN